MTRRGHPTSSDLDHASQGTSKPLSTSVRRGAYWSIGRAVQLRLVNVVTTAVVAHILNPHDFGIFAVAMTAYTIVVYAGELGVGACLMRADLDLQSLAPTMATISVATSAIQAGALVVFSTPIASALGSPGAANPIRAMALVVMTVGIFAVPSARLMRDFKQDKIFIAESFSVVGSTTVLLFLAKSGNGAMAFAWSRVVGQLISGCMVFAATPKGYRFGITRNALTVLLKFGLPIGFASFVNYVLLNVDYALIGHLLGAVALGTYVLAFNAASWPASLLSFMISTVSMPAFSRAKRDIESLTNVVASALRAVSLVVMPMSALTMVLARPLVLTMYGTKWLPSAKVLAILSIYGSVSIICLLLSNMLAGLGRTKSLLIIQLFWLGALLPAMAIGVRKGGITGAAIAHIAIIIPLVLPSYLFALKRTTRVSLPALAKSVATPLLASLAAAFIAKEVASLFHSSFAQLTAGLASGGLSYAVFVAPQAIMLLNRGRAANLHARRILRVYNNGARLVGLPGNNAPRHAAKGRKRAVSDRDGHETVPPRRDEAIIAERSAAAQLAALEVLISLAEPASVSRPSACIVGGLERHSVSG